MATLDQILLRLPRKTPHADFVDRFFAQIRGKGTLAPAPSITHQDLFLLEPDWIESAQSAMQEGTEFMQTESNFHPPPVLQRGSSPDIYRFTKLGPPNFNRFSP